MTRNAEEGPLSRPFEENEGIRVRRRPIRAARVTAWAIPVLIAFLLAACGGNGNQDQGAATTPSPAPRYAQKGPPRQSELGLSSFPTEPTEASYKKAFILAGQVGELILIQRAPPWQEFVSGGALSKNTQDTTQEEKRLAEENRLGIFFAVDPTDSADRGRLQGLPESLAGKSFADKEVRDAFIAYVKYVALNYKPQLLALGVEINMYYEQQPDDFENFVSLYFEAYDAVKDISPETLVFPTFQLEAMQNLLSPDSDSAPEWSLLQRFEPKLDLVAVSTYPSFVFDSPDGIPSDYFSQIKSYTSKPIAIASAGYSSGPGRAGLNEGTEANQAAFVRRLLLEADGLDMPFVVWLTGCDPTVPADPPFDLYAHMGLCRPDGSPKPAWQAWAQQAARPLEVKNPDE
jgi:hypothetical protein